MDFTTDKKTIEILCEKIIKSYHKKPLSGSGLYTQNMGFVLFLYEYATRFGKDEYIRYADRLMDYLCENLPTEDMGIQKGLCGFALGMRYLMKRGHCACPEIQIAAMEDIIFRNTVDADYASKRACAAFIYYTYKFNYFKCSQTDHELMKYLVNQLGFMLPESYHILREDYRFSLYQMEYVILDLLTDLYGKGFYTTKIICIINEFVEAVRTVVPAIGFNMMYLTYILIKIKGMGKNYDVSQLVTRNSKFMEDVDFVSELNENMFFNIDTGLAGQICFMRRMIKARIYKDKMEDMLTKTLHEAQSRLNCKLKDVLELEGDRIINTSLSGYAGLAMSLIGNFE